MEKKIIIIVSIVAISWAVWSWIPRTEVEETLGVGENELEVAVTFYPLEAFARAVGGDAVTVKSVVPAGVEPHDYEPSPQNIVALYQSDVFLLNGAGLDPWAEKVRPELERRGVAVGQMSDMITLLEAAQEEEQEEEEGHEEEKSPYDPHFWLDPVWAVQQVAVIRDLFSGRDPARKEVYAENAERYAEKLQELDRAYRDGLAACALDTVVTSHEAFGYLARRYGFETIAISGVSPEAEASPRRLAEIATVVKERGIRHIFFETLVSPKVAETLARETGAQTLVFNPIEGLTEEERAAGKDYVSIMYENLENLKTALVCQ